MLYASPRTILEYLACHGPSATRAEALVLLGRPVPDSWPKCRRRSRLSLLRRLACNRKKSASARLRALQEVIAMAVNTEPENVTANTTLSLEAHEMLRVTSKNHLRDVTDEEWSRYVAQHTVSETLCAEFWSWHLPDQGFLELISGREGARAQIEYWETVRRRSTDHYVLFCGTASLKCLVCRRRQSWLPPFQSAPRV
jgi:hypothetical protein